LKIFTVVCLLGGKLPLVAGSDPSLGAPAIKAHRIGLIWWLRRPKMKEQTDSVESTLQGGAPSSNNFALPMEMASSRKRRLRAAPRHA
jgi:hypothetical protein